MGVAVEGGKSGGSVGRVDIVGIVGVWAWVCIEGHRCSIWGENLLRRCKRRWGDGVGSGSVGLAIL